jgi:hypothetical protein
VTAAVQKALHWSILAAIAAVLVMAADYALSPFIMDHIEFDDKGVSFRLMDIWNVDRIDTPAGATGRSFLKAAVWILPWLVLLQLSRVWRKRVERAAGARRTIQRFVTLAILAVVSVSAGAVVFSDFILLGPYIEHLIGEPLSADSRAIMMHENLWWLGASVLAVCLAAGFYFLSSWTWGTTHATTGRTHQGV